MCKFVALYKLATFSRQQYVLMSGMFVSHTNAIL